MEVKNMIIYFEGTRQLFFSLVYQKHRLLVEINNRRLYLPYDFMMIKLNGCS